MISATTAQVAVHRVHIIVFAGGRVLLQQVGGGHDLARLAVTALGHTMFYPGLLQRVQFTVFAEAFYGGDLLTVYGLYRSLACAGGGSAHVHRAGTAKPCTTSKLGAFQVELVSEHPQQRGV